MLQPETHVFHRVIRGQLPVAERGDGVYILDSEGNRYLDASSGAAVSCLGHSNERVIESIKQQLDRIAFAHTGFFTSEPGEELADFLVQRSPEGLDHVYFVSGGSEAVEAALKMGPAVFCRGWRAPAQQIYCSAPELSRQHIGCIISQWQSVAAQAV